MRFHYRALQRDGRPATGLIDAHSQRSAHRNLVKRGMQPTAIARALPRGPLALRRARKINRRDYVYVLKQMHALVGGGVPIGDAVSELAESADHSALAGSYAELSTDLRRGEPFSRALQRCFPGIAQYVHRVVEAGELTGRLAEALGDAAAQLEREAKIRAELRAALVYPTLLIASGLAAILFIFVVVVPRFAAIFEGKFDQLPLLSRIVILGGVWLREHVLVALALAVGVAIAGAYGASRPQWRAWALALLSRVPVFRGWLIATERARWAAVLAGLLEHRVPLMQSLELARAALRDPHLQRQLRRVEREVRAGSALDTALGDVAFLPSLPLMLVRVGERSGNLPEMVRSVAAIYEEAVRTRVRTMLAIIEPAAILLLGGAIGLVATAIFLAITSINKLPGL